MMPRLPQLLAVALVCTLPMVSGAFAAEPADREQPVSIEANRGSIDNRNNVHIFEGGVVLIGTTLIPLLSGLFG